jgi:hypothetical protein
MPEESTAPGFVGVTKLDLQADSEVQPPGRTCVHQEAALQQCIADKTQTIRPMSAHLNFTHSCCQCTQGSG